MTYILGINKFSDWTHAEYRRMLGLRRQHRSTNYQVINDEPLATIDWRTKGGVNTVKDQAQCGSCWAFSAIAAIEGSFFVSNGTLLNLSEQQLVDCSQSFGNAGCNGGWMDQAFAYA